MLVTESSGIQFAKYCGSWPFITKLQNGQSWDLRKSKTTSSNGNIFRVTGHLCREFTGHRWIPRKKGQWRRALMFSLICAWLNGWVNSDEAVIWDAIVPIMTSLWCWKVQDRMSKIHHTALKFGTTIQQHCCKSHFTSHQPKGSVGKMPFLTHWSRYKTAYILQKVFSNASPSIKFVHSTGYNSLPVSYLCWAY